MNHSAGVVVPVGTTREQALQLVRDLMAPYYEGWWDWFVIGGRYTGMYSDDYEPATDPANMGPCRMCGGTGRSLQRPELWAPHDGDICSVETVLHKESPYTVVLPDGSVVGAGREDGIQEHREQVRRALEAHRDQWLVVLDYHCGATLVLPPEQPRRIPIGATSEDK